MIEALMTIGGSVVGGLFGWLNRKEDAKARRDDQIFELKRMSIAAKAEVEANDAKAFYESQKTTSPIADIIKSIVRPIITGCFMFMLFKVMTQLELLTGGIESFSASERLELYRIIVLNIVSLTATIISWWFSSRPTSIKGKFND